MARDVVTRQLLFAGRVTDGITGSRTRSLPALRVEDAARPDRPLGLLVKVGFDGIYAISADPNMALPPGDVTLRLTAGAAGYQTATHDVVLTAAQLARTDHTITVDGDPETVRLITAEVIEHDFALAPQPVILAGRVVAAEDPAEPIGDATVEITAPATVGPVTTNPQGFFTLPPAPVAAEVTLSISAAGRETETPTVPLDFRVPVNRHSFPLEQS